MKQPDVQNFKTDPVAPGRRIGPDLASDLVADPASTMPTSKALRDARRPEPIAVPAGRSRPKIGEYELIAQFPSNGPLEVFAGHRLSRFGYVHRAVLKRANRSRTDYQTARRRVFEEARAIAFLSHVNLCPLLDLGEDESGTYLAREHFDGEDLSSINSRLRTRGEALPFELASGMISEVLRGLHHAHTATAPDGRPLDIIHLSLHPASILVGRSGHLKLIDFGQAPLRDRQVDLSAAPSPEAPYLAPELLQGKPGDFRSDLWSAGVMLFELLTGRPCFRGKTGLEVQQKILRAELRLERLDDEGVPLELRRLVERATHPNPSRRFGSAAEMANAIETWMMQSGLHAGAWILSAFCAQHELIDPPVLVTRSPVPAPSPEPMRATSSIDPPPPPPSDAFSAARRDVPPLDSSDGIRDFLSGEPTDPRVQVPQSKTEPNDPRPRVTTPPSGVPVMSSQRPPARPAIPTAPPGRPAIPSGPPRTPPPMPSVAPPLPRSPTPPMTQPPPPTPQRSGPPSSPSMPAPLSSQSQRPMPPPASTPPLPPSRPSMPASPPLPSMPSQRPAPSSPSMPPPLSSQRPAPKSDLIDPFADNVSSGGLLPPDLDGFGDPLRSSEARTAPAVDIAQRRSLAPKPRHSTEPEGPGAQEPPRPIATVPPTPDVEAWSGDLATARAAEVIAKLVTARATGVLELRAGPIWKKLQLVRGEAMGLQSNMGMDSIGEQLVKAKLIQRYDLDRALRESARGEDGVVDRLLDMGVIEGSKMAVELGKSVADGVVDAFTWRQGTFDFQPSPMVPPRVAPQVDLMGLVQKEAAKRSGGPARPSEDPLRGKKR